MGATDYADFLREGEALAEGQIVAWRRFGHDVLIVENGTAALAQACGAQVAYRPDSAPVAVEPAIRSLDEVDSLQVPDPYQNPLLLELLKATRIVTRELGDRAFVIGRGDQGPFSLACQLRGLDPFLLDLALEAQPEKIHTLLDLCRQVTMRFAIAQIEQGAHCTSIGESPSGPDLISPRLNHTYAWPHVKRLMEDLHTRGIRCAYHI